MAETRPDRRSKFAIGAIWATRITSLAMEMVLPVLGGWWLDGKWGTTPGGTLAGVVIGVSMSGWHFWQMVRSLEGPKVPARRTRKE